MRALRASLRAPFYLRKPTTAGQPPHGAGTIHKYTFNEYLDMRIYKNRSNLDLLNLLTINTLCTNNSFVDHCENLYNYSHKFLGNLSTPLITN